MLNNFFKRTKFGPAEAPLIADEFLIKDFGAEKSLIYYKAKMLLRPNVVPRHFIKGDIELPFMRLNNRIFKEVFTWLNNNGHGDITS